MAEKLTIIRGDSAEIDVTFEDVDGTPINLTGKSVFFTVKEIDDIDGEDDSEAKISKKITVHTDPTAGETQIALSSEDTDLSPKDYLYDLQIVSGGDVISTTKDFLEIIQDVTKRIE